MVKEVTLATGANARHIIKRVGADRLFAFCPVGGDRKPVCLIAQSLNEKEGWIARRDQKGRFMGQKYLLCHGAHGSVRGFDTAVIFPFWFGDTHDQGRFDCG